jgi:MFS family permease
MTHSANEYSTTASGTRPLLAILASLAALGTLSTNILLPSLPRLAADFGVPTAATGSLMSSFFATFAISQLFVGPLSDRFGRRPVVLSGLLIFVAGGIDAHSIDYWADHSSHRCFGGFRLVTRDRSRSVLWK